MRKLIKLVRATLAEFVEEDPFTHAGALSYSSLLSFAPLLLMVVSVAGLVYGEVAARGEVLAQLESAIGRPAAELAQQVLAHAYQHGAGWLSATRPATSPSPGPCSTSPRAQCFGMSWHPMPGLGRGAGAGRCGRP